MPFRSTWEQNDHNLKIATMLLSVLQMITKYRSFLFGSYINLLNYIEQNSSSKLRVLLFFIICVFTVYIKITRILLYYFKINALRNRINPTRNELDQKRVVLQNEPQYRYVLNLIIILSQVNCYELRIRTRRSWKSKQPICYFCLSDIDIMGLYAVIHHVYSSLYSIEWNDFKSSNRWKYRW
jgi:hypothetical protein